MNGYQIAALVMIVIASLIYAGGIIGYSLAGKDTDWMGDPWVWILIVTGIILAIGSVIVLTVGYAKYT